MTRGARQGLEEIERPPLEIVRRLLNRSQEGMNGCWTWTGAVNSRGYGVIKVNGRLKLVHRLSYLAFIGEIPKGITVHHTCNNTRCIHPDHLESLCRGDNTAEANVRRRIGNGEGQVPF